MSRHRLIAFGSVLIAAVVLITAAGQFGSYYLGLAALHNRSNLSVAQACAHWYWIYAATARDATPALHAAVGRTLTQLGCSK